MGDKKIGGDMSKWYINRSNSAGGKWAVCPPINHDDPLWHTYGGVFASGAEAFAAFAAGAVQQ